jgi:hypothetical protein
MDATLYTGTGASLAITNTAAFKPDFVWIKSRNDTQYNVLQNSNTGAGKTLFSNTTGAETGNAGDFISSFNTNGFTVNTTYLGGTNDTVDKLNNTYVGWQWQAGQGSSSSNTLGTQTSTVSVNATAGFSVATFTNAASGTQTFGHGLGVAPAMVILKARSGVGGWVVYHKSIGNTYYLFLDASTVATNNTAFLNSTSPSSTIVTMGNISGFWGSSYNYVAYCWAEIAGYSNFGSYLGNGSTDGPFVYTGFRPKFLLLKGSTSSGGTGWYILDSTRNTYDVLGNYLSPNNTNAEASLAIVDFLSNGFKLRTTNSEFNASGQTWIYAAFASNPFKNSNAF